MTVHGRHRKYAARRWASVLTVLVFGFRALIPTGYMYAAVDGHTRLVMCPAGILHAAGVPVMPGMDHTFGMNHAAHAALAADHCPFALAGGAALLAAAQTPREPFFVILRPAQAPALVSAPAAPPLRYHAPRGPPSLA